MRMSSTQRSCLLAMCVLALPGIALAQGQTPPTVQASHRASSVRHAAEMTSSAQTISKPSSRNHLAQNLTTSGSTPAQQPLPSPVVTPKPLETAPDHSGDNSDITKVLSDGEAAYRAGHFHDAQRAFAKVWVSKKTYDVAALLGTVELRLGLYPEAAQHLAYSLRVMPPTTEAQSQQGIRDKYNDARTRVCALRIRANVPKVDIQIDARPIAKLPGVDEEFVAAGAHVLEARAPGYEPVIVTLEVRAGEIKPVPIEMKPLPSAAPSGLAPGTSDLPPDNDHPPVARSYTPLILGGAVFAVGAVAGTTFFLVGNGAHSDAETHRDAIRASASDVTFPCAASAAAPAACSQLPGENDKYHTFTNLAIGSFVVAGIGAVGGVFGYLLQPKGTTRMAAVPVWTSQSAGVAVSGRW